jgi:hypothetical protein
MEAVDHSHLQLAIVLQVIAVVITPSLLAAENSDTHVSEISLERTICFGTCPSYRVTIKRDGAVEYDGKEFVAQKGLKTSKISDGNFLKLESKIRATHFFDLEDEYIMEHVGNASVAITDLPTTIVTVKAGGRIKKIEDYLGAPKKLKELEDLIETVANTAAWTGHRADPELSDLPYYDSFPVNKKLTFRGLICEMGKTPDGKPRYMLCLIKNSLEFDLRTSPGVDLPQLANYVVEATDTIKEEGVGSFLRFLKSTA